jgi:hypothetical protein
MRTQLQAISLRIQTVRSNEQMMQSMKGATTLLGSMNRSMNLPALQRIAMEFEKENDIMDQRQEMMDDAIDDVTGLEDEEEGEEVVREVLDEIGVDLGMAVRVFPAMLTRLVARGRPRFANFWVHSWGRRLPVYRRRLLRRGGWRRRLGAREEGGRMMMIYRLGSTACGGNLMWSRWLVTVGLPLDGGVSSASFRRLHDK